MADRKVQGIDAENQDFARYEQVDKKQRYHLAEAGHEEAFDETYQIKTCDIGRFLHGDEPERRPSPRSSAKRSREIGFAILVGHGIDPKLYDEANDRVVELFTRPFPRAEAAFPRPAPRLREPGLLPASRRRATSIPTSSRAGSSAGAPSTSRTIPRGEPRSRTSGRDPNWSRSSGGCVSRTRGSILPVMQSILMFLGCDPASLRPEAHRARTSASA